MPSDDQLQRAHQRLQVALQLGVAMLAPVDVVAHLRQLQSDALRDGRQPEALGVAGELLVPGELGGLIGEGRRRADHAADDREAVAVTADGIPKWKVLVMNS